MKELTASLACAMALAVLLTGCGPGGVVVTREQAQMSENVNRLLKDSEAMKKRAAAIEAAIRRLDKKAVEGMSSNRGNIEKLKLDLDRLSRSLGELDYARSSDVEALGGRLEELQGALARADARFDELDLAVKTVRAETAADVDKVREEFAFVRGGLEENIHEIENLGERLEALAQSLDEVGERIARVEDSVMEQSRAIEQAKEKAGEYRAPLEVLDKRLDTITAELALLKDRISRLDAPLEEVDRRLTDMEARIARLESRPAAAAKPPAAARKEAAPDPAELYTAGYRQTMERDYENALETFRRFLSLYPDQELSDNAQYWIAEIYYAKGDWERAVLEFNKVIKQYPEGDKVAAALLKQGYAFEKLGAVKEARVLLEEVVKRHPNSPEADKARRKLKTLKAAP
ncbi:MAG TPA: tol-pal system protein YbgF [Deltaproteobacteria bacterium]|nr:tol-pal system protein YbgF [Deltaproteobacteria bacterium]